MDQEMTCHECGKIMYRSVRPSTVTYKGRSIEVEQPGWYCDSCSESVHSGKDIAATEQTFLELKAEIDGVLGPQKVKKVRTKLKLSQRKAGEILGGGPRAFQKYEAGKAAVSRPMSNLLRLLNNDPKRLSELTTDGVLDNSLE